MSNTRADRVAALIFEELSLLVVHRLEDPRLKGVSITRVRLTRDLKTAYVYFSLIGGEDKIKLAAQAFERAKGVCRRALGNLDLRQIPEIEFHHDKNLDHADRIQHVLNEISKGKPENENDD